MDFSRLAIDKDTTIHSDNQIVAVAKRLNEDEVIVSYVDLKSRSEVLRINHSIKNDSQTLQFMDPKYWKIYSGGRYISNFNLSEFDNLEINVEVQTLDHSIEIKSISEFGSKKQVKPV